MNEDRRAAFGADAAGVAGELVTAHGASGSPGAMAAAQNADRLDGDSSNRQRGEQRDCPGIGNADHG